ncbi:MAG: ribonuclease H-like domain-containing protein [Myxococcota bacterium]|jgi:hypothetical protein|nr:ribonuclease H-like domain-containing protein [Myxococcota bacterium]
MSLRNKLERRRGEDHPKAPTTPTPEPASSDKSVLLESLRQRIAQIATRQQASPKPAKELFDSQPDQGGSAIPGEEMSTPLGPVWIRRLVLSPEHCHGHAPLGGFHDFREALCALARDERLEGFDSRRTLLLDLETTGLDRGAGTLAFLIGTGWFEDDGALCVELLFCRDPLEEKAALWRLSEHMARAGALLTFNGRSFDLPLVNTRFVINQMKNPGWSLPHLDLLLAARRVFKRRLKDCSLGHLERMVLGFERHGDIPSAAIPQAYVDFLRGRDKGAMAKVLEHNVLDIVALAALGGELGKLYLDPASVEHALDHLGLACLALRAGDAQAAGSHLNRAMGTGEELTAAQAALWSAKAAARRHDHEKALELYLRAIELDAFCGPAHLALSKLYEHAQKDYARALFHAKAAADTEGEQACALRIGRLERKLAKDRVSLALCDERSDA